VSPVKPKKKMATIEDVIKSKDPEVINKKRSTIQRLTTGVRNNLDKLLVKTAGKFDHSKIRRIDVQDDQSSLKRHYENF
jgi:glutamine cyclotransferase